MEEERQNSEQLARDKPEKKTESIVLIILWDNFKQK